MSLVGASGSTATPRRKIKGFADPVRSGGGPGAICPDKIIQTGCVSYPKRAAVGHRCRLHAFDLLGNARDTGSRPFSYAWAVWITGVLGPYDPPPVTTRHPPCFPPGAGPCHIMRHTSHAVAPCPAPKNPKKPHSTGRPACPDGFARPRSRVSGGARGVSGGARPEGRYPICTPFGQIKQGAKPRPGQHNNFHPTARPTNRHG